MTLFWTSYAVLWGLTLLLASTVFLLLRHHGQTAIGKGSGRANQGPQIGKPLPDVELTELDGKTARRVRQLEKPSLVFVAGATCRACDRGFLALGELMRTQSAVVSIICLGNVKACQAVGEQLPTRVLRLVDAKHRVVARWNVTSTPFVCVIDENGIVRGKSSSMQPETLESLWHDVSHRAVDDGRHNRALSLAGDGFSPAANHEGGRYATDAK